MIQSHLKSAVKKLREYSDDDPVVDRERLAPLLAAFDADNGPAFYRECASVLSAYVACNIFIDELYEEALRYQSLSLHGGHFGQVPYSQQIDHFGGRVPQ